MRIATFNVQNMRLREVDGRPRLDGARDMDIPEDTGPAAVRLDPIDRRLTAEVLVEADADVVVLQEVFDQPTLDFFHDAYLTPAGAASYPYRVCRPGNDGRGLDVAIMSRRPLDRVVSHATETPRSLELSAVDGVSQDDRIFRRDCVEADIGPLTLFACHFKAPYPHPERSWAVRRMEAEAVAALIRRRFAAPATADWLVVGDLNEPGDAMDASLATAPLRDPFGVDLVARMPEAERWSFHQPHSSAYASPDAIIASPALARRNPTATPRAIRIGMDREADRYHGQRLRGVGRHRPHASDHAAILVDLADG